MVGLGTLRKLAASAVLLIAGIGVAVTTSRLLWAETLACSNHLSDLPEARSAWTQGNLVILTRHTNRCRAEAHNCPEGDLGLTPKGVAESFLIAAGINDLGPATTDVYYSPTLRTTMTAWIAVHQKMSEAGWLVDSCNASFLDNVKQAKIVGHNLLLFTHSSCINAFEDNVGETFSAFNAGNDRFYGASLMYLFEPNEEVSLVGCVLPGNWLPDKIQRVSP